MIPVRPVRLAGVLAMAMLLPGTAGAQLPPVAAPSVLAPSFAVPLLATHLEQAMALDATARGLAAQRDAVAARGALVRSPIAGSPLLDGSVRGDTRGPRRAVESELGIAAPVWLPGQRSALGGTVSAGLLEVDARLLARRLELAGLLREAWWNATGAAREVRLARDRLATSRDIGRDVARQVQFGDVPLSDELLTRNESLAAEVALSQAEADLVAVRATYRVLTGGAEPDLPPEPLARRLPSHPALLAAETTLAAAEARARLVAATLRDNPELGVFGRREDGDRTEQGTSFGLRLRLPLATEARNAPRRADAQAELTRAAAELEQRRRLVNAEIAAADVALRAAEATGRLARQRLGVADQQLGIARRAFQGGEIGLFDLYRVRQLQVDAAGAEARTAVAAGRARSRLNQAVGAVPGA